MPKVQSKGSKKTFFILVGFLGLILLALVILIYNNGFISVIPGGPGPLGTSCIGEPGFACNTPTLTLNGTINFLLTQTTGKVLYNVELACLSTSNSLISSSNSLPDNAVYTPIWASTPDESISIVQSGNYHNVVNGLPCYTNTGKLGPITIGTNFVGVLYMNYTTRSEVPSVENPWHTEKVAVFETRAS